jgi:hypothetical protein
MSDLFGEFKNVPIKPVQKPVGKAKKILETEKIKEKEKTDRELRNKKDRIVIVDDIEEVEDVSLLTELTEETDFKKYIILGDIINHPKFKK